MVDGKNNPRFPRCLGHFLSPFPPGAAADGSPLRSLSASAAAAATGIATAAGLEGAGAVHRPGSAGLGCGLRRWDAMVAARGCHGT